MNFLLTGATGFIGEELREILLKEGHFLKILTRSPKKYQIEGVKNETFVSWDADLIQVMEESDVVINLVGENVFGSRWNEEVKKRIYDSRIDSTRQLVDAMREAEQKPELFISASASGYYGHNGDEKLYEGSGPGDDFLAKVCIDWEAEAMKAAEMGLRVAIPRIGIVLEKRGGALDQMIPPFQFFVGGPVSHGNQYMPWIHRTDLCHAILFPVQHQDFEGVYNAVGPAPVTMNMFAKELGKAMHRPSLFRVPEIAIRMMFGEGAKPILDSIRAHPKKLLDAGFTFRYEEVDEALNAIF